LCSNHGYLDFQQILGSRESSFYFIFYKLAQVAKFTGLSLERVKSLQDTDSDDSQALVEDFLELSESSLNKIWLSQEEDEAWKDL
jgi:hypothetical protein